MRRTYSSQVVVGERRGVRAIVPIQHWRNRMSLLFAALEDSSVWFMRSPGDQDDICRRAYDAQCASQGVERDFGSD